MVQLKVRTSSQWIEAVLRDFDSFLQDHANCERKASGSAMNLASHYPDKPELVSAMIELAREELEHFAKVYEQMAARGVLLAPDRKDSYVQRLSANFRKGSAEYFLDRLLAAGILEARGCERFGLVAAALPAGVLKDLYRDIARSEVRHQGLYLELARRYFDEAVIAARLEELLEAEARIVSDLPPRPALH
ncbi:MAG TPA: tRNA-(ms[2]io[6]A)-hydroxylase [Thermoanaerobaculia bacterium]|nr:tRNA-(ms[2]io[6]A)-hydroxylase [Thermoanaerobaculia bacterium]HMF08305.1 tRNA-(ms[2]io[6]A)-hydroxylase [Thermoanaerobaculia bacterium]